MGVEKTGKFITLRAGDDSITLPYPSNASGKQIHSTMVNQARTADGVMRGEVIGCVAKVELKWRVLTPATWTALCNFFDKHFTFSCEYYDMVKNAYSTRIFYVGDRSAQPFIVDSATGKPKYWLDCQANIIGVGGD
jgi:hypothetical protein